MRKGWWLLLPRDQYSRRVAGLADEFVGLDFQPGFGDQVCYRLFDLPAPERRDQTSADRVKAIERLRILADHDQRKTAAGTQHASNFAQREANIVLAEQFQQVAAHDSVETRVAERHA